MSPEPFVSCAKVLPAKRREKGYGDENGTKGSSLSRVVPDFLASANAKKKKKSWDSFSAFLKITLDLTLLSSCYVHVEYFSFRNLMENRIDYLRAKIFQRMSVAKYM